MAKDKELQSRRQFFKKAAKSALPILGAIVLANIPKIVTAEENDAMGCHGCSGTCKGSCRDTCRFGCNSTCRTHCTQACGATCKGGNYGK